MDRDRKPDWANFLMGMALLAVSLYPLYRDELARYRIWIQSHLTTRDPYAEAPPDLQREISRLEHGS
jgi:hypothetical protein